MKLAVTLELYAYWSALRGARSAPERNDIDPGAIRSVLADTFVLDFDSQNGFPLRIAGSRANALFLRELRGVSFLRIWREADRQEVKSILECVADEAQPFLIGAEALPAGLASVDIEVALLPLRHHGLTHSRILGSIAVSAAPDWLGLIGAGQMRLTSLRSLDPKMSPQPARETMVAPDFSVRNTPTRHGHLFVYSRD